MQHVKLGNKWNYTSEPFDKFETNQIYGRNKRDRAFIPTKVKPNEDGLLSQGSFKVIKTKEKGTIMIVPGPDNSDKILLFADVEGGFRGGCGILESTANVIAKAHASAASESGVSFAAILELNQFVDVQTYGRYGSFVIRFSNHNGEIKQNKMTEDEYVLLTQSSTELESEEL